MRLNQSIKKNNHGLNSVVSILICVLTMVSALCPVYVVIKNMADENLSDPLENSVLNEGLENLGQEPFYLSLTNQLYHSSVANSTILSNPDPYNGEENVNINHDLSWNASDPDSDTLKFDVYFGVDENPPLIAEKIEVNSFDPGQLELMQTYYWYIVAWENQNSTHGPTWSFTTAIGMTGYTPD